MRMTDFLCRDALIPAPQFLANTRDDAIREMVVSLQRAGQLLESDIPDLVRAILRREQLGTTGIGRNIAIPHSRHPAITQLIGTLAVSPSGVGFDSVDGEPVFVLVLIVSPPDRPGDHLRALECVVSTLRDDGLVRRLRDAQTGDEIWAVLTSHSAGGSP